MGHFGRGVVGRLATSVLTKDSPAYVQFYVTARCNLRCEQCNVIYANADQEEATTDECRRIAENLAHIGTSVVLLTGGEPFVRRDIAEIARAMIANGIHPRLQTNGLASPRQLEEMVEVGAHDISISLDSLIPDVQDTTNGGYEGSWERAIRAIARVNEMFPETSFAALGCVLSPRNLEHVTSIVRFATEIGWWVSLVPAHVTSPHEPRAFSTFDQRLRFPSHLYPRVHEVLEEVKIMRSEGSHVYDSDEYLDDIYRFVTNQPVTWRRRNNGRCDSPNLYFAIQPNGDMAVCCDYRLPDPYPVQAPEFPEWYRSRVLREQSRAITSRCTGCMYGSFPEISISARFFRPMLQRAGLFLGSGPKHRLQKLSAEEMMELARNIAGDAGLLAAA